MGPSGGFYAIRKNLFKPVPENFIVDDFYICMNVLLKGKKAVSSLNSIVYEDMQNSLYEELRRKARISTGDFQNLINFKKVLLNPFKVVAFSFVSHKVLRWISSFIFLIILFTSSILMADSLFFFQLFIVQLIFLLLPIVDITLHSLKINIVFLRFTTHLMVLNVALLTGFFKNMRGIKNGIWNPTKRIVENGRI